jgi:polyisoprenoid-binding protein YceI
MKKYIFTLVIALAAITAFAQKKTTTSAIVTFDATTSIDNLPKAENRTVIAALDASTGIVQFEAAMKNFAFSNPTIQEHFNQSKWMNSDAFPKASFTGKITNLSAVNFKADGTYNVNVEGVLNIRGQDGKVSTPATIVVKGSAISATATFSIKLADYGIEGGAINAGKVSKEPNITVAVDLN